MHARRILAFLLLPLIIGCASEPTLRTVLLPDQAGHTGAVVVTSPQGEVTLSKPYIGADVYPDRKAETKSFDETAVQKQFGPALAALPQRPVSYILYFIEGRDELRPDSKPMLNRMKRELERRPFPQITVIGHTDTLGSHATNDALSLKRAEAVRRILVASGIAASGIETAGRGSRELLIPTGDNVAEPRNRRVEISIR